MANGGMSLEVDPSDFIAKLKTFLGLAKTAIPLSEEDVANELLRLSQIEVPLDEGTLMNSGIVDKLQGDTVVGYNTVYAARLHEHPEYRFKGGRKGKYLEDPIVNNRNLLGVRFTKKLEKGLTK